jgi:hypothetical protein
MRLACNGGFSCGPAFLVRNAPRVNAESKSSEKRHRDPNVVGSIHILRRYGHGPFKRQVMSGKSADYQPNREPNPFFVHGSTFRDNLKNDKSPKVSP